MSEESSQGELMPEEMFVGEAVKKPMIVSSEMPVSGDDNVVRLADGRTVPRSVLDAMKEYEVIWPEASLPQARAGLAFRVIQAWERHKREQQTVQPELFNPRTFLGDRRAR